jgi:hypothetical protein
MSLSRPPTSIRIATGPSAIVAGLAWIAKDIGGRVSPDPDYFNCNSSWDYLLNGIDTVAFLVMSFALLGLRELFRGTIGSRGAWLAAASAGGFGVAGLANLLEHCAGLDVLGLAYVLGLILGMFLLVGFALTLRRAPMPRGLVWLLLLGGAAGILLANQGGYVAFGGAWVVLGVALIRSHDPLGARRR